MSTPAILSLHTGLPQHRIAQEDVTEEFIRINAKDGRRAKAIRKIFGLAGVGYRNSVRTTAWHDDNHSTQQRNDIYMAEATALGVKIVREGVEKAGFSLQDVDDLFVVSCTGVSVPGLDLLIAGQLGMRPNLRRTCIVGMGCYGVFPAMLRATEAATHGRLAVVYSVELCTLHMQHDLTTENVVSTALFSDGAGMLLVGDAGRATQQLSPRYVGGATQSDYQTLEHMSFHLTDHGFRMYLSSYVPDLLAAEITSFVDGMLGQCGLRRDDVQHWGIHPGSTKIVEYVQEQLGLRDDVVDISHEVLHDQGNMSSATILFVLDRIQQCKDPQPGDYGVLLAFGPGLTMEGAILQW